MQQLFEPGRVWDLRGCPCLASGLLTLAGVFGIGEGYPFYQLIGSRGAGTWPNPEAFFKEHLVESR